MIGQPFVLSVDESTDKVSSHSEVGDEGLVWDNFFFENDFFFFFNYKFCL